MQGVSSATRQAVHSQQTPKGVTLPVFTSKSEQKVQLGRKQVEARTIRHLNSECALLAKTGESGTEFAKNVNRARNTEKLRENTVLCTVPGCWTGYVGTFAEGVEVPQGIAARVSANLAKETARKASAKKEGKAAKKPAKASRNAKAQNSAAKAKAARKRKPKPAAPAAAVVEQPASAEVAA